MQHGKTIRYMEYVAGARFRASSYCGLMKWGNKYGWQRETSIPMRLNLTRCMICAICAHYIMETSTSCTYLFEQGSNSMQVHFRRSQQAALTTTNSNHTRASTAVSCSVSGLRKRPAHECHGRGSRVRGSIFSRAAASFVFQAIKMPLNLYRVLSLGVDSDTGDLPGQPSKRRLISAVKCGSQKTKPFKGESQMALRWRYRRMGGASKL
jgi:hypothetical protein